MYTVCIYIYIYTHIYIYIYTSIYPIRYPWRQKSIWGADGGARGARKKSHPMRCPARRLTKQCPINSQRFDESKRGL